MAPQYLKNNHFTYYVITQVGVYAAQQWYVLRPSIFNLQFQYPKRHKAVLGRREVDTVSHRLNSQNLVYKTSYVHSSNIYVTSVSDIMYVCKDRTVKKTVTIIIIALTLGVLLYAMWLQISHITVYAMAAATVRKAVTSFTDVVFPGSSNYHGFNNPQLSRSGIPLQMCTIRYRQLPR